MDTAEQLAERLASLGCVADPALARDLFTAEIRNWQYGWPPVVTYGTTSTTLPYTTWAYSPEPVKLTAEEKAGYAEQFNAGKACVNCGGLHLRACPRVKRLAMRNSEEISEVEFWPDGWPASNVVFPEDVFDEDE